MGDDVRRFGPLWPVIGCRCRKKALEEVRSKFCHGCCEPAKWQDLEIDYGSAGIEPSEGGVKLAHAIGASTFDS